MHQKYMGYLQRGGGGGHPDYRSMIIEPIYRIPGKLYEIKEDGYLAIYGCSVSGNAVMTLPLSEFDLIHAIDEYNPSLSYDQWSKIVKYNDGYWIPRQSVSANNNSHIPGGSGQRWASIPSWMPTLACYVSQAMSDADESASMMILPVYKGERYIAVNHENTENDAKELKGTDQGYDKNDNVSIQYLPPTYQTTPVGLLDTGNSFSWRSGNINNLRFNTYRFRLTGLDPYMNEPELT